jgi:hypothetical protein
MSVLTCNGHRVAQATIEVGSIGPWVADLWMEEAPTFAANERATIALDNEAWLGTVVQAGTYAGRTSIRCVAGAAAWGTECKPLGYHSDGGVKAATVFADLCRLIGETAGSFVPSSERLGQDFTRDASPASAVLESIIGTAHWWIDVDGKTYVGERSEQPAQGCTVVAYDPIGQTVELSISDLSLRVGSIVNALLPQPLTVRSYRIEIGPDGMRAKACVGFDTGTLLRRIITAQIARVVSHPQRYRVVAFNDGRCDLQIAERATGYPDLVSVTMWSGAGQYAALHRGAEVMVSWERGDRSRPYISGFAARSEDGFAPASIALVADEVRLGGFTPSQHAAVAELVDARIATLVSAINTHVHTGVTTGPGVSGPGQAPPSSPTPPPPGMITPQASVAAEKVLL